MRDVIDTLQNLNTNKASWPDNINPTLLKQATTELSKPLADLFNFSLQQSSVLQQWKIANVTLVHKQGATNTTKCIGKMHGEMCLQTYLQLSPH